MWYPRADPPLSTGKPGVQQWISRTGSDVRQYAPAAERNAGPILAALRQYLPPAGTILEIGSGTGQHVVAFAAAHPELIWQPSDPDPAARASIAAWIAAGNLANVGAPLDIDVPGGAAQVGSFVYCAAGDGSFASSAGVNSCP